MASFPTGNVAKSETVMTDASLSDVRRQISTFQKEKQATFVIREWQLLYTVPFYSKSFLSCRNYKEHL